VLRGYAWETDTDGIGFFMKTENCPNLFLNCQQIFHYYYMRLLNRETIKIRRKNAVIEQKSA